MKSLELSKAVPFAGAEGELLSDERLMEMIQGHILDALDLLHERYAPLLRGVSMNVLHNRADTEDLLQEVFMEIWNRAGSYDPLKGTPLAWLLTLVRRRSIDRLRKRDTYTRFQDRFEMESKVRIRGWTHVHEDVAKSEMNEYLRRALADLPEPQRIAIRFAYHEQMTQREIAAHTGIPLGTIKTRLELGLRKLGVYLARFKERDCPPCAAPI